MAERKNPELDAKHQAILRKMMQLPENKQCADCKAPSPRWASTNLGIFICISCSGIHRKLGTHISQVRSVTLDTWTPSQIAHFQKFGNAKAAQYFEACLPSDFRRPSLGDSRQLEQFIRDKYEKKRYITVENGGLGGLSAEHRASSRVPSERSGAAFGAGAGRYDDVSTRRGTAMGLSYGDRFRAGSQANSLGRRPDQLNAFGLGGVLGGGARAGSAIQRAATLKQIMQMGFSADVASRAVEVSGGDLQRAVDWVLENAEASTPQAPKKMQEAPNQMQDLLSFEDVAPAPAPKAAHAASVNVMGSEHLLAESKQAPASVPTKAANDEFEDFADFGAFESALPAANAMPVNDNVQSAKSSLGSSIASLYNQSQPKSPAMPSANSKRSEVSPILQARASKLSSPMNASGSMLQKGFNMNAASKLGAAGSRPVAQSVGISSGNFAGIGNQGTQGPANNISNSPPRPPPPPAMQQVVTSGNNVPPPPDSPPPARVGVGQSNATDVMKSPTGSGAGKLNQSSPAANASPLSGSKTPKVSKVGTEKQEDPFAALSLFALNSAKANRKHPSQKIKHDPPSTKQNNSAPLTNSSPPNNGSAEIDLDALLG